MTDAVNDAASDYTGFPPPLTSHVQWCEYTVSVYHVSPYIAEFHNAWTNIFYAISAILGIIELKTSPSSNPFLLYSERCLLVTAVGSFFFHSNPSSFTELLDELPMVVLAGCYLMCLKGNHWLLSGGWYIYTIFLMLSIVIVAFISYLIFGSYELFTTLFTFQTSLPILITFNLLYNNTNMERIYFKKAIICIILGRIVWEYERHLFEFGNCPKGGFGFYAHCYWHLFSSLAHFYFMKVFRGIECRKGRREDGGEEDLEMQRLMQRGRGIEQATKD